jgi:monooxygenase
MTEHFDVLIVGAGISGVSAAYHLQRDCPSKTYAILEGRSDMGGTWDLFKYPGIRSDSDMYTLGFSFRPWEGEKAIADGHTIKEYIQDTAAEYGIDRHIRFNHRVVKADWSSEDALWTLEVKTGPRKKVKLTSNFVIMCSGYYRYEEGYTPEFPGRENFKGQVIHPQLWPENLDYAGKKVVVIGSGATAVTLIPSMAKDAGHVTMLQRSPSYVLALPEKDAMANAMRKFLPSKLAYSITRAKNVGLSMFMYELSRRRPELVKKLLRAQLKQWLGDSVDIDTHFKPSYTPWDQRLCMVPNGDLFRSLKKGTSSIVTDHIDHFTENGIKLKSGDELEADIIITATGLEVRMFGGTDIRVDGKKVKPNEHFSYKGMMLDDVPNAVNVVGYTNASWTLKADLTCEYTCRLINHMDKHGYDYCQPHKQEAEDEEDPLLDLNSGYVLRALDRLPKQGQKAPWRVYQNYVFDLLKMRFAPVDDDAMEFHHAQEAEKARLAS